MTNMTTATLPIDLGSGPFAVTTRGLAKRFGSVRALDGLDLQVPEGAVYVLVGPNGAGKSTLIRTLMGLVRYQTGSVSVLGRDPGGNGAEVRASVGHVPEDYRVGYAWMTVGRLLEHHAAYHPSWDAEYVRQLSTRYEIDPGRKCHALSKGQSLYEVEPLVDHVGVLSEGRLLGQLPRNELRGSLLRYWADVPEGWRGPSELGGRLVRRSGAARAIEWTVWGDRDAVTRDLSEAGAAVREVAPLSVDEAAVALLSGKEAS